MMPPKPAQVNRNQHANHDFPTTIFHLLSEGYTSSAVRFMWKKQESLFVFRFGDKLEEASLVCYGP